LYPFDDMAPVFWASSEGSGGEKSKEGTPDIGFSSTGLFIGANLAGSLLVSDFRGGFASMFEEAGSAGGFCDRHLTE
jgi:hypothetical protein